MDTIHAENQLIPTPFNYQATMWPPEEKMEQNKWIENSDQFKIWYRNTHVSTL